MSAQRYPTAILRIAFANARQTAERQHLTRPRRSIAQCSRYGLLRSGPAYKIYDFTIHSQRRSISWLSTSSPWLPPAVFISLVLALWLYKCLVLIIFQNRIVYMPFIPPFSRSEKILDYSRECKPIVWEEVTLRSLDKTRLSLCVASNGTPRRSNDASKRDNPTQRRVVVLYLQGNASSLPPRLPALSRILRATPFTSMRRDPVHLKIVALSYRGYWTSSGRPSPKGIRMDVAAALDWIIKTSEETESETDLLIWGQSIGAGIATTGLADLVESGRILTSERLRVSGLILETPFTSMKEMLISIYPQRWLPYRYLWPFLKSRWDNRAALTSIAKVNPHLRILMLEAGNDELVPPEHGSELVRLCDELGFLLSRRIVQGAYHTETMSRPAGQKAVLEFLNSVYSDGSHPDAPRQKPLD